jgi:large repetitive protein
MLPDGIDGDYYLILFSDSNLSGEATGDLFYSSNSLYGVVPEFRNENNNLFTASLRIDLTPPPDLQVSAITVPERATVGQQLTLSYVVTNSGPGATPPRQSTWQDQIYQETAS